MNRTFRRKVLSLSLATTLAIGAFGIPALAAPSSEQVNNHFERDANKLYKDIFKGNEDELRAFRNDIRSFINNVNQATVEGWFGKDRYDKIAETIGSPRQFALDVVELIVPGETSIGDVDAFRAKYEDAFEDLFGDENVTVDDFLLFFIDLQKEALNPSVWKKISSDDLSGDIVQAIIRAAAEETLSKNKHAELNRLLRDRVGISLNEIVSVGRQVLSNFTRNSDYRQSYIKIREILFKYAINEIIKPPSRGGGGGGSSPSKPSDDNKAGKPITPISQEAITPKVTVTVENGVTVVKLDQEDLKKKLEANNKAKAIVISVKGNSGVGKAVLSLEDLKLIADHHANNLLIIQNDGAEYALPISVLSLSELAKALKIDRSDLDDDAVVEIALAERSSNAYKGKGNRAAKIFDFSITVKNNNDQTELKKFGKTFVDRAFELNRSVNAAKSVGVVFDANGNAAPIPTQFVRSNGKDVALLKRNSNSTYTVVENDIRLRDISSHWARADIQLLTDKLIVSGYEDGTFKPQNNVTRAEFATLIVRALGLPTDDRNADFRDISSNHWYAGAVKAAVDARLVAGYEDGTFRANQQITRQEASTILANTIDFLELRGNVTSNEAIAALAKFNDGQTIASYARESVGVATSLGLIRGNDKGDFNPVDHTTRAETIAMLTRMLEKANFISK